VSRNRCRGAGRHLGQPVEVAGQRERPPVDRLHGLEDAVTHGQPVVENGDSGGLDVLQPAVEPELH